jgi:hypothetical protein
MITKIEIKQSMVEINISQREIDEWCKYLESGLSAQYPEADVVVKEGLQYSLYIESDEADEPDLRERLEREVEDHIGHLWNEWC